MAPEEGEWVTAGSEFFTAVAHVFVYFLVNTNLLLGHTQLPL